MRAINEDDVKRLIRSEKRNWGLTQFPGVTEALNHVEGGLVGIRTVESPMPRWISVEERLPNIDEEVLICTKEGLYDVAQYTGADRFWTLERNPSAWVTAMGVTHWMPLPEPPKEE